MPRRAQAGKHSAVGRVAGKPAKTAARKPRRPREAKPDDLKRISGIGPRLEKVLNGMGVRTFADIANWTHDDMLRMDETLGLDHRVVRDRWVEQAKALLEG